MEPSNCSMRRLHSVSRFPVTHTYQLPSQIERVIQDCWLETDTVVSIMEYLPFPLNHLTTL